MVLALLFFVFLSVYMFCVLPFNFCATERLLSLSACFLAMTCHFFTAALVCLPDTTKPGACRATTVLIGTDFGTLQEPNPRLPIMTLFHDILNFLDSYLPSYICYPGIQKLMLHFAL